MQPTRLASLILLSGALAFTSHAAFASSAPEASDAKTTAAPVEPKAPHSFDLTAIDKTADPCVDFYQYACGNWRKDNPIPGDQSRWGRFNQLNERNRYLLYVELKQATDHPASPLQRQYGDFFAACMNTDRADQLGIQPIQPLLDRIAKLDDRQQLAALVALLQSRNGSNVFFSFGVEQDQKDSTRQIAAAFQDGLTLPDRDYYIDKSDRMAKIRDQYRDYVISLFKLAGDSDDQAKAEAGHVIDIETTLAQNSMARVDLRDPNKRYHLLPVSGLKSLAPDFDWSVYLSDIQAPSINDLNVGTPDFFKAMNQVITGQSLDAIRSYLRFHVINGAAPWLSSPFEDASFGFFQKTLQGQAEQTARWKRCTAITDRALGEAVGQDWVKQNFPPQDKASMEKLVAALKTALASDIQSLPWMTEETKKQAEAKLDDFRQKIGYPDKWRDYSKLEVTRDNFITDIHNSDAFEFAWQLDHIGRPVDEKEWGMTPPTVNAYYDPSLNDINFPAGILQPPFYDASKDPAVNFGGIGVVIGHEMTHGFDDEGSQYDGQGNVKNWWTPDDRKAFDQRTDCEVTEYGSFEPVSGQKLNGKLTLGENTADNGGLHIAWQALLSTLAQDGKNVHQKIDGYTEAQRFFISFAQVWCENRTDQASRVAARVDPHSPGRFRANGSVQNFDEFGKAFGCHKGQPMMPDNPCRVW
ncbi:M13 family metallopeptidase [Paracidobacterium acidisoli]|uniref:M13 family peptidase n=1 Tax=Paracidobacterium acidisoli TaxID=2303751 RepID=A0A372IQG8_9BACT|nr:M13 family metallopeptidase [Paracidobacterium acidisoli]MBT9331339.1 M13 family metallopeptidase [Paracidobacterium acidisoli]